MDDFIGVNLRREDPTEYLEPIGFVREYHGWSIDEENTIPVGCEAVPPFGSTCNPSFAYPNNANKWSPGFGFQSHTQFPVFYQQLNQNLRPSVSTLNKKPICSAINYTIPSVSGFGYDPSNLQRSYAFSEMKPVWPQGSSPILPASYQWFADYVTQFSNHFVGPNISAIHDKGADTGPQNPMAVGYVELWNETDKTFKWYPDANLSVAEEPRIGFTSKEYAAISSATYDGHQGTMTGTKAGVSSTYPLGVSQFPNQKFVMAGLSDIANEFTTYLSNVHTEYNLMRGTTGQFPFKVLNFHHYCDNNWIGLGSVGVSPESDIYTEENILPAPPSVPQTFKQRLKAVKTQFIGPGKICPDCEIWMSEFGWDTNLGSDQRAPAIGANDQEEVQGQWLVRGYLEVAAAGWDRAMQFCIRDGDSKPSSGRFQASGILRDRYHNHAPKKSFYYISTMKESLKNMKFQQEFSLNPNSSGNTAIDVRIQRFVKSSVATPSGANNGDYVLALWLPSSSATTLATSFNLTTALGLPVSTSSAVRVMSDPRDMNGLKTALTVTSPGTANPSITIPANTISERPIYIIIGSLTIDAAAPALVVTTKALSCNSVRLAWNPPANTFKTYRVYYYEKNDTEENGVNPAFNPSNRDWKLYAWNYPAQVAAGGVVTEVKSLIVSGLAKMDDEYHFYVEGVTASGVVSSAIMYDVKTLSCEGATINSNTFTVLPASAALNAANTFTVSDVEQCYPQNLPISHAPSGAMPANVTVTFGGGTFNIESLSIYDVNNAGYLTIEYSTDGITFLPYKTTLETYFYEWWTSVPVPYGAVGIKAIRINKTGQADYGRIIIHGKPANLTTYTAPDCCPQTVTSNRKVFGTPNANPELPSTSVTNLSSQYLNPSVAITTPEVVVNGILNLDLANNSFDGVKFIMMTGSKINVPSGKTLQLNNCNLRGCTHLWSDIALNDNSRATIGNSAVRDALIGLSLNKSASQMPTFSITNSRFERCHRGIFSSSFASFTSSPENTSISVNPNSSGSGFTSESRSASAAIPAPRYIGGSFIDGTDDDLKPHWNTALTPGFNKRAYIGIDANDLNDAMGLYVNHATTSTTKTTIKNLFCGIKSENSLVYVKYTAFQNLNQPGATTLVSAGINATNTSLTMSGKQTDLSSPSDRKTFEGVDRPILLQNCDFSVEDVRTSDVIIAGAIIGVRPRYGGNKLRSWNVPKSSSSGFSVSSNTTNDVEIANSNLTAGGSGDGIYVGVPSGTSSNPFNIHHNSIQVRNTTANNAAIRVLGTANSRVEDNPYLSNFFYSTAASNKVSYGIFTANTTGIQIKRNKIDAPAFVNFAPDWDWDLNSWNRVGLFMQKSSGWKVECNTIDGMKRGLLFDGACESKNGLLNNELRLMPIGLELRNSGVIGTQTDRWTKWTQPNAHYLGGAARHGSTDPADWFLSKFKVPSGISPYSPQNNVVPTAAADDWFDKTSIAMAPAVCAPALAGSAFDRGDTDYDEKVRLALESGGAYHLWVLGKVDTKSFGEVGVWQMQKAIYHALHTQSGQDYADLPEYANFLNEHYRSAIGTLYAVEAGLRDDLDWSLEYEGERKKISAELEVQSVRHAQANYLLEKIPVFEREKFVQDNPDLFEATDLFSQMLALDAKMQKRAKENVHTLELINLSVPAENRLAALEQSVNEIHLRTLAIGNYHFDAKDLKTLEQIAKRCPVADGDAVMQARILYGFYDINSPARWSNECKVEKVEDQPLNRVSTEQVTYTLRTIPNPSSGDFWYQTDALIGTRWQLSDIYGRAIKQGEVNTAYWVRVDQNGIEPGLYLFTVFTDKPVTSKLIRQ
jgi:hypothetical protein